MKLCSIASGSSGNCIYIGSEYGNLLIDAGISGKRIEQGLTDNGLVPETLDGILITHEHSDHISGLGVLARKYGVPIYATVETIVAISKTKSLGKIDPSLFCEIEPNQAFEIKDVCVNPFSISHDAANPVCYSLQCNHEKVSVATDLGTYDDYIIDNLKNSDILLLEANHDINMLQVGSYPYMLKRRILGDKGHLSNENSGRLIKKVLNERLQHIFLGHLSKENNYPDLAYQTVMCEIEESMNKMNHPPKVSVAKRDEPSGMVSVIS